MPKLTGLHFPSLLLFAIGAFFLVGCGNGNQRTEFPSLEFEYSQPTTRAFKFSDPKAIQWAITPPDSIQSMPETKFDLANIPEKPFEIGEGRPFIRPMVEKQFDFDKIADTSFELHKLPTDSLRFKTYLLGRPRITKARVPSVRSGASRGVLEAGKDMGLMSNGRCFIQDKNGQIWIGTDRGLWRYDGENLETYAKAQGLNEENISSMVEDDATGIWLGTLTGKIYHVDIKAGLLHELIDTLAGFSIYSMVKDNSGKIWAARAGKGISIIDPEHKTFKSFSRKEGLIQNFNVKIIEDSRGLIWISTTLGVNVIDQKKQLNKRISQLNGLNNRECYALLEDRDHRILIGGTNGLDIIDRQKGSIAHLSKDQGFDLGRFIPAIYQDRSGKVWMGTDSGFVYNFDLQNSKFERIRLAPGPNAVIFNFSEDKNNQLWIGTIQGGCFIINSFNGRPGNFTKANGLGGNNIWSIKEDNSGNIWLGTYTGLEVINRKKQTIKHIDKKNGLLLDRTNVIYKNKAGQIWTNANNIGINIIDPAKGSIKHFTHKQGLPNNFITAFFEDSRGQMWLGANDGNVYVTDLNKKIIKQVVNVPDKSKNQVNTIIEDSNGQIWISKLLGGVFVIDKSQQTIQYLSSAQGLISNEITTLLEDHEKNIWIGTEKGIDLVNLKNNTLSSFTTREGLSANSLYTLDEYKEKIFVGTSNGLNILYKDSGIHKNKWLFTYIGKTQGLTALDFAENSTYLTKDGQFWGGVEDQILTIIDLPKKDTIVNQSFVTGIRVLDKPLEFKDKKRIATSIKQIDTIWKNGNDSFYKNKDLSIEKSYQEQNNIVWDSIIGPYLLPANLQLPFNQNFLTFSFSGTHIANPDQAKYRYILEGIDKNWSPISENAFSENYRDLPSGFYKFRVASKGMNGIWSEPAEFSFTILPPWWKTWWAYLIYILIFIGIIRAYIVFRSRSLQRENQVLEEKIAHRTNQLQKTIEDLKTTQTQLVQSEKMASLGELTAGIAHEIQNPLNFINNFSEVNAELIEELEDELSKGNLEEVSAIAKDIKGNEEKITFHGKRADGIVKGMLQHSRNSTGKKEPTDLNALADEYLRLAYHGLRAKDKSFNSTMKTDFDQSIGNVQVISQDIGRVILNLITNAFYAVTDKKKLGVEGFEPTVWVGTKKLGNKVEIRVKDNGMGVPSKVIEKIFQPFFSTKPTGEGTGLGLSMSYDIVTKGHEGELIVNTQEGEYAEFVILLPILQF